MTDYKQLCAELVAAWDDLPWHYDWKGNLIGLADGCQLDDSAVERARAALAEPEPQRHCIYNPVQIAECGGPCEQGPEHCDCGELWVTEPEPEAPTQRQLLQLAAEFWPKGCEPTQAAAYARAVLARWGNHPGSPDSSKPQPVPVSKRLPGSGDCDMEGRCWTWAIGTWRLSRINRSFHTHWLPAHALPLPS